MKSSSNVFTYRGRTFEAQTVHDKVLGVMFWAVYCYDCGELVALIVDDRPRRWRPLGVGEDVVASCLDAQLGSHIGGVR